MKKIVLIFAAISLAINVMAQVDSNLTGATTALENKNYDQAKQYIDNAMANPDNQVKPKALLLKAEIYLTLQYSDQYKAGKLYMEAAQALFKLKELRPAYSKNSVDAFLRVCLGFYYNDGAIAYNDKKLTEASYYLEFAVKIRNMNLAELLPANDKARFDSIAALPLPTLAYSYYYQGRYDDAIPLLYNVVHNPIITTSYAYTVLIDALQRQNRMQEKLAAIQDGRKAFPDDKTIRDLELNYYISLGNDDEVLKKLEEAAAKDLGNATIQFYIATTCMQMAMPPNGKKPANRDELIAKAENAYSTAVRLAPDSAVYNYNFGGDVF